MSPDPTNRTDRRVRRTHERLRDAIVGLVAERGYARTSIHALLVRADVGRSTFYAHYGGKDALLASALSGLEAELRAASANSQDGRLLPFTRAMLDHVATHRHPHHPLPWRGADAIVFERIRRLLVMLTREDLAARRKPNGSVSIELLAEHAIGSFLALLEGTLASRRALDPTELDALFRRLVIPGLELALG